MTDEQYNRLQSNCTPHPVFSSDWLTFTDKEFADAMLPNAGLVKGTNLYFFDGAELLPKGCRFPKRLMRLPDGKAPLIAMYSYPKDAKAAQRRERVVPQDNELLLFAEIDRAGKANIYLKAGENVKKAIEQLHELQESKGGSIINWGKAIKTSETEFFIFFEDEFSHYRVLQYAGKLLGIDMSENGDSISSFIFKKIEWQRKDGSVITEKSDIHYGETVKLSLKVKDGMRINGLKITIGVENGKTKRIDRNRCLKFMVNADRGEVQTPFFKIPFGWYDESGEEYDYNEYYTKIPDAKVIKIMINAEIGYLKTNVDKVVPTTYRRNYEELIGLSKLNNGGICEVFFINKGYEIEGLVNDFVSFMESERADSIGAISERVKKDARMLWELAVEKCRTAEKSDDRTLYWARIKMQVALKRHPVFRNQIDFKKSIVMGNTDLDRIIKTFENLSRNYTGIDFSQTPDGCKKVLLMGFDPFQLDKTYYGDAGPNTFNPSGLLALQLHGKVVENAYVQTCIFPVKYEDFDNKVVEGVMGRYANEADVIISTSLNGDSSIWDIERYAVSYRGGFHDNMNKGEKIDTDHKPDNNGFDQIRDVKNVSTQTTLPWEKIFKENKRIIEIKEAGNVTILRFDEDWDKDKKKNGSGGNYLSNEIMYRITKYRDENGLGDKPVGHVHIGNYGDIKGNAIALDVMKEIIRRIVS